MQAELTNTICESDSKSHFEVLGKREKIFKEVTLKVPLMTKTKRGRLLLERYKLICTFRLCCSSGSSSCRDSTSSSRDSDKSFGLQQPVKVAMQIYTSQEKLWPGHRLNEPQGLISMHSLGCWRKCLGCRALLFLSHVLCHNRRRCGFSSIVNREKAFRLSWVPGPTTSR